MKKFLSLILAAGMLSSCASVINGRTQDVGISSNPAGATVTVDGINKGVTPCNLLLKRNESHTITIEKEGYQPASATVSKGVSGWIWGNVLIGGLIGLGVDALTGGMWTLEPENVQVNMSPIMPQKLPSPTPTQNYDKSKAKNTNKNTAQRWMIRR